MKLPKSTTLPFFAYGLFKPGEICYFRIQDLVENSRTAYVSGILKERDAIPLLVLSPDLKVKGVLIRFREGFEEKGYRRISDIEPGEVYYWEQIKLSDQTCANVLLGKNPERGSSDLEYLSEWTSRDDPFFTKALDEIESILNSNSEFESDFKSLFRLQMAYVLLWSAIERYAGLRYHLGTHVNEKVNNLAAEKTFAKSLKKHVDRTDKVYRATDLKEVTLDPNDPEKSIKYYYQVRSNAVHRGKAVIHDFQIIRSSLEELLKIFKDMLKEVWDTRENGKL